MAERQKLMTIGDMYAQENERGDEIGNMDNINLSDDNSSDPGWVSEASSSADSVSEDCPMNERLQDPTKYFQELDRLESLVLGNSMFQFYMVRYSITDTHRC